MEGNELIWVFTSLEGRGYHNGEKGRQGCCRSKSLDNYHNENIFVFVHSGFIFSLLQNSSDPLLQNSSDQEIWRCR
jgi:hypothetical protein